MTSIQRLTPVEWEIMEAVWQAKGQTTVRDIHSTLYPDGEKAYTTVMTIMNTLEKKGLLQREKLGMVNFYVPRFTREDLVKNETQGFVSKVFHGSLPALASYLIDSESLTLEEIQAMKETLDRKESELKG